MDDIESKLELLFEHLIGRVVVEVFIEEDAFILHFDDNTVVELFSEDDLNLYYELPQKLH